MIYEKSAGSNWQTSSPADSCIVAGDEIQTFLLITLDHPLPGYSPLQPIRMVAWRIVVLVIDILYIYKTDSEWALTRLTQPRMGYVAYPSQGVSVADSQLQSRKRVRRSRSL